MEMHPKSSLTPRTLQSNHKPQTTSDTSIILIPSPFHHHNPSTTAMSKGFRNFGFLLVGTCGVLTSYATFRPEFEAQQGLPRAETARSTTIISDQMREDFKEAGKEWSNEGGFAWGIRQAFFGRNPYAARKDGGGTNSGQGTEGGGEQG